MFIGKFIFLNLNMKFESCSTKIIENLVKNKENTELAAAIFDWEKFVQISSKFFVSKKNFAAKFRIFRFQK
jgi:hypothetical protein